MCARLFHIHLKSDALLMASAISTLFFVFLPQTVDSQAVSQANLASPKTKTPAFSSATNINPKSAFAFDFLLFLVCLKFVQLRHIVLDARVFPISFLYSPIFFFLSPCFVRIAMTIFLFSSAAHIRVSLCSMLFSETINSDRSNSNWRRQTV